jgi:hypothetical protein
MPQYAWVKAGLSFTPYPLTFSQTTREVHTAYPNRIETLGTSNPHRVKTGFISEIYSQVLADQ